MQIHALTPTGNIHDCHTGPFDRVGELADTIAANYDLPDGRWSLKIAGDIWDPAAPVDAAFHAVRNVDLPVVEVVDVTDYAGPWEGATDEPMVPVAADLAGGIPDSAAADTALGGTVEDILTWVDNDYQRAKQALAAERTRGRTRGEKARSTLISRLEEIIVAWASAHTNNA